MRYQFAEALAKEGKLTAEAVQRVLVEPGLVELFLPDCKHLEPAALISAVQTAASPEHDGAEPALRILKLRWCGRGFGNKAAEALVRLGVTKRLEALELSGLYHLKASRRSEQQPPSTLAQAASTGRQETDRQAALSCFLFRLQDEALSELLSSCESLVSLDLPYKSHVSAACLQAVARSPSITSLSIAHSPQVGQEGGRPPLLHSFSHKASRSPLSCARLGAG